MVLTALFRFIQRKPVGQRRLVTPVKCALFAAAVLAAVASVNVRAVSPDRAAAIPQANSGEVDLAAVPTKTDTKPIHVVVPDSVEGIYWLNLRDTAEYPKWALPTITYHEGVPGHHLQLSLQQEADLPMIRRATFLSAYGEGWALYAEELAREMGVYEGDPRGEIGYIQAALFRAARLVVDTGMHAKRWSREKAIETMTAISGTPAASAIAANQLSRARSVPL